jgi:hypothetical protein
MVIKRLESGAIIPALQPGVDSESTEEDPKLRRANVKLAHDILGRIYNDYPSIVRVLQEHEIEERRRLRGPFGQMYNWA